MGKYGKVGQELINEAPLTLAALIRHPINAGEEQWFARCRADFLRAFPLSLIETVRTALLLCIVGPATNLALTVFAGLGLVTVLVCQRIAAGQESGPCIDQVAALARRSAVIRVRGVWWGTALAWAAAAAPDGQLELLVAMAVLSMMIDGLAMISVPLLAIQVSIYAGALFLAGLFSREGWSAAPAAVIVMVTAVFLHWSIFNLYYLFATRRIRTRRLSESNETIRLLLNQYDDEGSDWLYEIDQDGRIHNPSARFCAACKCPAADLEGMPLLPLLLPGQRREELARHFRQDVPFRNCVVSLQVNGTEHWWSVSGRPVHDADGTPRGWRGFIADITAAKSAEAKVAFMAHYDLLTQLPNRTLFNATLERAFTRLGPKDTIGLLYVDLDHFKAINDTYGHAMGDKVLTEVARLLDACSRPRDMVARLGGDEFVILLPDLDHAGGGLAVAERIMETIGAAIEIDGQIMPIGASIGMAFAPHDGNTGEELLRAADLAMYDAKSRGRRGISIFDQAMQAQVKDRRALELDLRAAIARQELDLHYQPLVDLKTGATIGYEALLRWNHATRGPIPPNIFIPIAEETGMIVDIGEWVIRHALAEAASWPAHLTVAVNLSPAQMRQETILPVVISALASSGVEPQRLELEITESLLMQDTDDVLGLLHKLRGLGVRIALDDFGTGYSSLNYLRSFPFDKIKIDRCFVSELAEREDCQAIVRSVIALANDLNMTTTAEGVEDVVQLTTLRDGGCDQVQGFYYSKAIPAEELHYGDAAGEGVPEPRQRGGASKLVSLAAAATDTGAAAAIGRSARRKRSA